MHALLVLVTHPRRRLVSALVRARAAAREATHHPGVTFARAMLSGPFPEHVLAAPIKPGRAAVMLWGSDPESLVRASHVAVAPLERGAKESWRVLAQLTRSHGQWKGFAPKPDGAPLLRDDEPAVMMISGVLKGRYLGAFIRDNLKVVAQLRDTPGYLGGFALADTPLTTTSFSCWRTARESRTFGFGAGAHQVAYKVDRAEQRHRSEFFVRFRPVASEGSVDGRNPLEGLV